MQRIATAVRTVEAMPAQLGSHGGSTFADRDELTVGIKNGTGAALYRGQILALGTWVVDDVYTAATPTRASNLVAVVAGQIGIGLTGRAWVAGIRLVRYRERTDSYGGTIAAPAFLGPVAGKTYLSTAPFGEFELLRIVTAATGSADGLAWAKLLQPAMSKLNTITTLGASPKILANLDITTA